MHDCEAPVTYHCKHESRNDYDWVHLYTMYTDLSSIQIT